MNVRRASRGALLGCLLAACSGQALAVHYTIVPTFGGGFDTNKRAAVQQAVNLWNSWLTNSNTTGAANTLEVKFTFKSLGGNTLGQASINWIGLSGGYALTPAQYMVATNTDLQSTDGQIDFNTKYSWYTGTDGKPSSTQIDLESVALHEIGHQLGMTTSYYNSSWGYSSGGRYYLTKWDSLLRDEGNNSPPLPGSGGSFDVTGGAVRFTGANARSIYGGDVPVYSPNPYAGGSSLSHFDYGVPGTPTMEPGIGYADVRHGLYDFEVGAFTDLGWNMAVFSSVHAAGRSDYWNSGSAWVEGLPPTAGTTLYLDAAGTYTVNVQKTVSAAGVIITSASGTLRTDSGANATISGDCRDDGTVQINNGSTLRTANTYVGYSGTGRLLVNQGGSHVVTGQLVIGYNAGASGTCNLAAASLSVGTLIVGGGGSGALSITYPSLGGTITVSNRLQFGAAGSFSAATGSAIHMTGTALDIRGTSAANLAGLSNLNLIVEDGPGALCALEAAGRDLGANTSGWSGNFALGTLTLGGSAVGRIQLVNNYDNTGVGAAQAVYVNMLVLNAGAHVELNGLNLYYRNGGLPKRLLMGDAGLDGQVDFTDYQAVEADFGTPAIWTGGDFDGDGIVTFADYQLLEASFGQGSVPEPALPALLAFGAGAALRRRTARQIDG